MTELETGTYITEWQERINLDRLRKGRLKRVQEQLKEKGLGAILCYSRRNQRYITGLWLPQWAASYRHNQVLLCRDDEPYVYVRNGWVYLFRRTAPWIKRDRVLPSFWYSVGAFGPDVTSKIFDSLANEVKKRMKDAGVAGEPIGVDMDTPIAVIRALERVGLEVVDGEEAMIDARAIKLEEEIECLRVACAISEALFDEARRNIKPGVRGNELMGTLYDKLYKLGSEPEFTHMVICIGPWTDQPGPCRMYSDRMIRPGDLIHIDVVGASWMGYTACYYRNFVCGKASKEQRDAWEVCNNLLEEILKAFKPGNTTKDVAEKFPTPDFWGYKEDWEVAGYCVAHGMGMGYDKPWISRPFSIEHPIKLEENMVVAVEPFYRGVRLEDMIVLRPGGYELLTKYPRELIECNL
ncbi:MAG: Xaa-Pro peptidase family protein [Nitrososphaerota archaeon]|nr:Xaa-Pro peptidase family protein [Nitrososphaerota archaeon]